MYRSQSDERIDNPPLLFGSADCEAAAFRTEQRKSDIFKLIHDWKTSSERAELEKAELWTRKGRVGEAIGSRVQFEEWPRVGPTRAWDEIERYRQKIFEMRLKEKVEDELVALLKKEMSLGDMFGRGWFKRPHELLSGAQFLLS
jgi:hypothetical protein